MLRGKTWWKRHTEEAVTPFLEPSEHLLMSIPGMSPLGSLFWIIASTIRRNRRQYALALTDRRLYVVEVDRATLKPSRLVASAERESVKARRFGDHRVCLNVAGNVIDVEIGPFWWSRELADLRKSIHAG